MHAINKIRVRAAIAESEEHSQLRQYLWLGGLIRHDDPVRSCVFLALFIHRCLFVIAFGSGSADGRLDRFFLANRMPLYLASVLYATLVVLNSNEFWNLL